MNTPGFENPMMLVKPNKDATQEQVDLYHLAFDYGRKAAYFDMCVSDLLSKSFLAGYRAAIDKASKNQNVGGGDE
jgi:hypothetical protein